LAFANFLVWQLRIGACGFWRYRMPPGYVRLGKASIAVKTFGVCDFSFLAVTDWRLRRWRWWFLALMTAARYDTVTPNFEI